MLREKNYYAPDEKKLLLVKKLVAEDAAIPNYDIITCGERRYSTIICYELTDIKTRALLKGKVNEVYAIEFNSDTNYYSSLVESLARDIQSFVVQVNTAQYGDSRITAPYKTEQKDIVKIKGGVNDTFIVGQVNVAELNAHVKSYHRTFQKSIALAANPKRKTQKSKIKNQAERLSVEEKKDLIAEINKTLPKEKPLSAGKRKDAPEE